MITHSGDDDDPCQPLENLVLRSARRVPIGPPRAEGEVGRPKRGTEDRRRPASLPPPRGPASGQLLLQVEVVTVRQERQTQPWPDMLATKAFAGLAPRRRTL